MSPLRTFGPPPPRGEDFRPRSSPRGGGVGAADGGGLPRRAVLALPLALAACRAHTQPTSDLPPLKSLAPFPLGVAAMTGQFDEGGWCDLARTHFDRVTADWEMKMEAILRADGSLDFSKPDRLVEGARALGLTVHGHTLVWYAQAHPSYAALVGDRPAFARKLEGYIATLMGRWRETVRSWDVVNEAITEDGEDLRECLWSRGLGGTYAYVAESFHMARRADPTATLFLNDYFLDSMPNKRRTFLALAERLLKDGVPLGGLGTQTHTDCTLPAGAIKAAVADLARLGLPVHLSEIDVSTRTGDPARQPAIYAEAVEAVLALPPAQRFGLTTWGLRDSDSWLNRNGEATPLNPDRPLLFDGDGRPKAAARAVAGALGV